MKKIKISQIQFEAQPTPFDNANQLKKYFEKTRKFSPDLICTPECSNIITNDINYLKKNATYENNCPILLMAKAYAKQYKLDVMNIILSNMYGPQDHFEAERSHALGALIMKFVEAKQNALPHVDVWGSGKPVREWLHVDDGAQAMIRAMSVASSLEPINIGVAKGISIIEMAKLISHIVEYEGEIKLDLSKLDGAPYKTVDGTRGRSHFGWQPEIAFEQGVRDTIAWYLEHKNTV